MFDLPYHCFVQMGDFSGYTVQVCAKNGIKKAYVAGFMGKLAKMSMGVKQTQGKASKVDMEFLARRPKTCGNPQDVQEAIKKANTARHVFEIINEKKISGYFDVVCEEAHRQLGNYSDNKFEIKVIMFD